MADTARNDPEVVRQLGRDLDAYLRGVQDADVAIRHQQERTRRRIEDELRRRRAGEQAAATALRHCLRGESEDCSAEAHALEQAAERVRGAERSRKRFEDATGEFRPAAARFGRVHDSLSREIKQILVDIARDLDSYNRASAAAEHGGGTAAPLHAPRSALAAGGGRGPALELDVPAGFPSGFALVPLAAIDTSDRPDIGPGSFGKNVSVADLEWAFRACSGVIMPALRAGRGLDYFAERDARTDRYGSRSLVNTFTGFFHDDNAIRLAARPDGTFRVENGYHRIWAARHFGLTDLPARVVAG